MPLDLAFAPYRLAPGALPEEAARAAEALAAEPLLATPAEPLPAPIVNRALADLPAGRAAAASEACRAADGTPSGLSGPPRACLTSERQRARVAEAARAALAAGFAGVCLDRPDAPLALGLLGAGFCSDCQRALARELEREYGEHFQPLDYLALAREAVAQAPGVVSFDQLPFGRDFWRVRNEALETALRAYVRSARDASRESGRPFEVVAQFEALGPAQLRAARHLDAAIFPAALPSTATGTGIGLFRLLRAAMGRRPAAIALPPPGPGSPAALARLAAVAATCGIEISGLEPGGAPGAEVASVRRLARQLAQKAGRSPVAAEPIAECAVLYSAEADLWTGGRHRRSVERVGDALAALHVQAPVVTGLADVPAGAAIVLADATALAPAEAKEIRRRLEAGTPVLAFGDPAAVDEAGRPAAGFLPSGKASGVKVGAGILATLPPLAPEKGADGTVEPALLEKALAALLGRGRRAASVAGRAPVLVVLHRVGDAVDAHLVSLGPDRAQGATLFLGLHVAGGARRGRFVSADGTDVRIPMNPSGYMISTVLPSFRGYAVLSVAV
jgi:hypothetical protein